MFKKSIFIVKGISGSGKSSRVFQLLSFFRDKGFTFEDFFYTNKDGKVRNIGINIKELNLIFIGKLYNSNGVERWQGYDSVTGAFIKASYFSEFLFDNLGTYGFIVDGAGITQTNRLRPKFLAAGGFKNIFIQYYNYLNKEDYLSRIIYRSGAAPKKDVMWDKNGGFISDYNFSMKEISEINDINHYIDNKMFDELIDDFGIKFLLFTKNENLIEDFMDFVESNDYINKNSFKNINK